MMATHARALGHPSAIVLNVLSLPVGPSSWRRLRWRHVASPGANIVEQRWAAAAGSRLSRLAAVHMPILTRPALQPAAGARALRRSSGFRMPRCDGHVSPVVPGLVLVAMFDAANDPGLCGHVSGALCMHDTSVLYGPDAERNAEAR